MKPYVIMSLVCLMTSATFAESYSNQSNLNEAKQFWLDQVVEYCEGFPAKENCDDGDATIFNGLLCVSGNSLACDTVRDAQDSSGRWWRSPRRTPGNLGQRNSFSRDQALGVLLYLAKTKDSLAARDWLSWIDKNRACSIRNPITGGCTLRGPHRFCRDDDSKQCTISPTNWAIMAKVWDHLNLPPHRLMDLYRGTEKSQVEISATEITPPGYQLHLKGVQILLLKFIVRGYSQKVLDIVIRKQANNPFFKFLKNPQDPTITSQLLELCPSIGDNLDFRRHQWSWERDTDDQAWQESMGWDCVFLANLIMNSKSAS